MQNLLDKKVYSTNIFIIILFTLSVLYLLYTNLNVNKKNAYAQSYIKSEYLAQFISSDMDRLIHGVHELIKGIRLTEEHIHDDKEHDRHINNILKNSMEEYMLSLVITDNKGEILHWTRDIKKINIKYREYIKYHIKNKDHNKSLFVDEARWAIPIKDKEFFAISKGFYEEGKLDKIIIAYIDLDYLKKRYSKYLNNQTLTITSKKGKIYFRTPSNIKCCGLKLKEIDEFIKKGKIKEDKIIFSSIDKEKKLTTFISSINFPIITSIEIPEKEVLASWENHKNHIKLIAIFIILVALVLIFYYTKLQNRIDKLTRLDSLTQIYNRAFFTTLAQKEFSKAKRANQSLPILVIDIDDFKNINDTYGHQIGDQVIIKLANTIKESIREVDSCGRFGGEEFVVLLSNTNISGAQLVANRIKENFKKVKDSDKVLSTVSIGLSDIRKKDTQIEEIINRADEAMYISKKEGKDRVNLKL